MISYLTCDACLPLSWKHLGTERRKVSFFTCYHLTAPFPVLLIGQTFISMQAEYCSWKNSSWSYRIASLPVQKSHLQHWQMTCQGLINYLFVECLLCALTLCQSSHIGRPWDKDSRSSSLFERGSQETLEWIMGISQGRDEKQQSVHYQASYHCGRRELNRSGELSKPRLPINPAKGQFSIGSGCFQGNSMCDISGFPMRGHSVPKARESLQVEIFRTQL